MEEDILSWYSDLVELALDDPVDQKNFLRKIFLGGRFLSCQKVITAKGQKDTEKEGEKITDPTPRSSPPVWLFSHSTLCSPTSNGYSPSTTILWGNIPAKAHGFPSVGIRPFGEF